MTDARRQEYIRLALEGGADRAALLSVRDVATAEWVRMKCRYGCDGYGMGHLCPPHTPGPEETRRMLASYSTALIFAFENVRPNQRLKRQRRHRNLAFELERRAFLDGCIKSFAMGCGPCRLCRTCDTDRPCRHPIEARPAMEACGIDVYQTAANAGWKLRVVRNWGDTMTMLGLVLLE